MKLRIIATVILALSAMPAAVQAGFPEFSFCPLGGPPGWANRMFNLDDDYRRYPPPYYAYPVVYAPPQVVYYYPAPVPMQAPATAGSPAQP